MLCLWGSNRNLTTVKNKTWEWTQNTSFKIVVFLKVNSTIILDNRYYYSILQYYSMVIPESCMVEFFAVNKIKQATANGVIS